MSEPLGARDVSVQRRAASTVTGFVNVPGATSTFTIRGTVQPLNGREFYRLPDGLRSRVTHKLYSTVELFTVKAGSPQPPDRVLVGGEWMEVHKVEPHGDGAPIPHFKYMLAGPEVK